MHSSCVAETQDSSWLTQGPRMETDDPSQLVTPASVKAVISRIETAQLIRAQEVATETGSHSSTGVCDGGPQKSGDPRPPAMAGWAVENAQLLHSAYTGWTGSHHHPGTELWAEESRSPQRQDAPGEPWAWWGQGSQNSRKTDWSSQLRVYPGCSWGWRSGQRLSSPWTGCPLGPAGFLGIPVLLDSSTSFEEAFPGSQQGQRRWRNVCWDVFSILSWP